MPPTEMTEAQRAAWEAYDNKTWPLSDTTSLACWNAGKDAWLAGWAAAERVAILDFYRAVIARYERSMQAHGPLPPAEDYLVALQDAIDAELAARGLARAVGEGAHDPQ